MSSTRVWLHVTPSGWRERGREGVREGGKRLLKKEITIGCGTLSVCTERNHKPARKVAHVLLPLAAARNKSRIRKTHTVRGGLTPRRCQAASLPFVSLKCHIYI